MTRQQGITVTLTVESDGALPLAPRQLKVRLAAGAISVSDEDGNLLWLETQEQWTYPVGDASEPGPSWTVVERRHDKNFVLPTDHGQEGFAVQSLQDLCEWLNADVPEDGSGTHYTLRAEGEWPVEVLVDDSTGVVLTARGTWPTGAPFSLVTTTIEVSPYRPEDFTVPGVTTG